MVVHPFSNLMNKWIFLIYISVWICQSLYMNLFITSMYLVWTCGSSTKEIILPHLEYIGEFIFRNTRCFGLCFCIIVKFIKVQLSHPSLWTSHTYNQLLFFFLNIQGFLVRWSSTLFQIEWMNIFHLHHCVWMSIFIYELVYIVYVPCVDVWFVHSGNHLTPS